MYIPIGAILGILSSVVLLFLHVPKLVQMLRRFIKIIWDWMSEIPNRIMCYWWWRQQRPTWQIEEYGKITVTTRKGIERDDFFIEIPIKVVYENRNARYILKIDRSPVLLLYHEGKGMEGAPFKLQTDLIGIHSIRPLSPHSIDYLLSTRVYAKPKLGTVALCKLVEVGDAQIMTHSHYLSGSIKRKGSNKFWATVQEETDVK